MWECSVCNKVHSDDDPMPSIKKAGLLTCQSCYEDELDDKYEKLREERYTGE